MIETIVTSAIALASKIADAVMRKKPKTELDKPLTKLESEKIVDDMLARARAMAEAEKQRKREGK